MESSPSRRIRRMQQISHGAIVRHVDQCNFETARMKAKHCIDHNHHPPRILALSPKRPPPPLSKKTHSSQATPWTSSSRATGPSDPRYPQRQNKRKSHFTFSSVLLVRPEACKKPMIPAEGLRHAPTVDMLHHVIWFLERAVDEDQEEQCH
jgi:hypothetical protein